MNYFQRIIIKYILPCAFIFTLLSCSNNNTIDTIVNESSQTSSEPTQVKALLTTSSGIDQTSEYSTLATSPDASNYDIDSIVAAQEQVMTNIYENILPSIVRLEIYEQISTFGFTDIEESSQLLQSGEGSGFVWSAEGHIITNQHVIANANNILVVFADGSEYSAEILGGDPSSDIAVLKISSEETIFTPARTGNSKTLKVGQLAIAIGSPFGQGFSMTQGIISALDRLIDGTSGGFKNPQIIQTDTPINPGNSGGPLLDRHGEVIGINSQIISRSGMNSGVGFAIPINTAKLVVPHLIETGKFEYPYLGISGLTLRPIINQAIGLEKNSRGVLITQVMKNSAAEIAGLNSGNEVTIVNGTEIPAGGDVITAINGTKINSMSDLISYLVENHRPGNTITLNVNKWGNDPGIFEVELKKRPD